MRGRALPGFGLTLGVTLAYLGLMVLLPLAALVLKTTLLSPAAFWAVAAAPRALAAYRLTFGVSFAAAALNVLLGATLAWVLERYAFPGRGLVNALVDLPLALPTAIAGITLATLFTRHGWFGRALEGVGVRVAFTPLGILVALVFIGLPFVVRTLQPVLADLPPELEEAGACLGASRSQVFARILAPELMPAALTGFALAFARGLGEYGSVIFIAGNMPLRTEVAPLVIMTRLEQQDLPGASAIALVMLAASFALLLSINLLQGWRARRG